jgi:hypothetical protein
LTRHLKDGKLFLDLNIDVSAEISVNTDNLTQQHQKERPHYDDIGRLFVRPYGRDYRDHCMAHQSPALVHSIFEEGKGFHEASLVVAKR